MNEVQEHTAKPGPWERHTRSLAFGIFILALGVLAGTGAREASSRERDAWLQQAPDKRVVIDLSGDQRDAMLVEMRGLLTGIQTIMDAASKMDVGRIRTVAKASGTAAITGQDSSYDKQLPQDFRRLEAETRAQFDALSDAVRGFTARDTTLAYLSRISQGCVACHGKYKLAPVTKE
jgi:cytochrome c556